MKSESDYFRVLTVFFLLLCAWVTAVSQRVRSGAVVDEASASIESDPPESGPVLVVLIDQQARNPGRLDVADSLKASVSLGLVVDGGVDNLICDYKADGHEMRTSVSPYRCEPADRCRRDQSPHRLPVHVSTLAALKEGWREALAAAHQMP